MPPGELITRWTIRVALILYALALGLMLFPERRPEWMRLSRWLWTAGCALYLAHVAAAFHFFHGWSHAAAERETARQTGDLFGTYWGGGLWFNYVFTAAWVLDAGYWWLAGTRRYLGRPQWVTVGLHAFLAFMAFNGAVVFAAGWTRWVAVIACTALAGLLLGRGAYARPR